MVAEQDITGFGLSPQQKHLWLLQQSESSDPFHARCAVAIEGRLDAALLDCALQEVVDRHEIFRTRFVVPAGMKLPLQVVMESAGADISRHDLSGLDGVSARAELDRLWRSPGPEPWSGGAALRAAVSVLSPTRHHVLLTLPALCSDTVGMDNLVADLASCLRHRLGRGEPLADPFQYADLAEWQNEVFKAPDARQGREFWRRQSPGPPPPLLLSLTDGERSGSFAPEALEVPVEPAAVAALEALAVQWGGPPSLVWLGCWQVLLARLCGEPDLLLGVVLTGRNYADLETVPGLFARCVPLRSSPDLGLSMGKLVGGLLESIGEIEKWQECFGWDPVAPREAGAVHPYLPVCFEAQPQLPAFDADKITLSVVAREVYADRFDLKLVVGSSSPQLHFDSSRFCREHVRRLGDQLGALLDSLVREPDAPIADLSMIGACEREETARLNQTVSSAPPDGTLVRRFEEQVAMRAAELAVVDEDVELTWSELDARANRLARYLIRLGVGPEVLVAVLLDRSVEMIVALLGVLKAGGAYVPLDPRQPRKRLELMIEEVSAKVLLTMACLPGEPLGGSVRTVLLDEEGETIGRESAESPAVVTAPHDLVYVLFTSGSTGRPKGVAVEQRQILNYLDAIVPKLQAAAGWHYAMVSTFAADLGNTVLFPALTTGGLLYLISQERAEDPVSLAEYFASHGIDVLKIVPSHFQALLAGARPERVIPRKCLVLGGEACPWDLVERVRALRPECRVLNHYGPTETTVGVLVAELAGDRRGPWVSAPIGRPLANTRVHLVDHRLRPVPWGALGELYIGGAGLARGYFGRPDVTAVSFVPDPFGGEAGGRLYRTGDLARLTPSGEVVFAGRADQQVKLRGYRIELGEVEAVIRLHPEVRESAVTAAGEGPGGVRLIAYFVAPPGELVADDLRSWVRERLPEPMVPSAFVRLKAMPLTPNGKLDRRALVAPEQVRAAPVYVAPQGAVEEALASIWQEVLKVERVGSGDNFFDLGGDSILSIQIVARANRQGLRLVPRQIFEKQTIAALAPVVGTVEESREESGAGTGPVPLTPVQLAFFEQEPADPHHYNHYVLLESSQALGVPEVAGAVRALLAHHDSLRLRFDRDGSQWRQTSTADVEPSLTVLDLDALPGAARDGALETAAAQIQAGLDLARGPLFRVTLFRFGSVRPDQLLLVAHHLVIDGVSWRILLEDFQIAYEQLGRGLDVELQAKTTSFQRWAERLTLYAQSEALRQELAYWVDEARLTASPLPVDHPQGINTERSVDSVEVSLDVDETRALLQEVPRAYGTQINDALLAALVESFARWTGGRTLRLDLEGHGREEELAPGVDLSRTVGWFTSVYPVFLDLRGVFGAGEALTRVKERLRQIPLRGIRYGILRYLADRQTVSLLAAQPAAEVSFNYFGQLDQILPSSSSLRRSSLFAGPARSPRGDRRYLIQVVGWVEGGRLHLSWKYSAEVYRRETIEVPAAAFLEALRSLIHHCSATEVVSYTPSDFPEAELTQDDLDSLLAQLGRKETS